MKKVLSIMLAAMMLVSLFAVGASASVATYEGYEVKTILAESANVKSAMPYIRNKVAPADATRAVSSFATVGEGEDANEVAILKYSADGQEWLFGSSQANLAPYEKLVFTFDVNVVNCASGLQVGFNTGTVTTSFVISPATFMGAQMTPHGTSNAQVEDPDSLNLNQWYNFRVTVDKSVFAAATAVDETVRRNAMTIEWKKAEDEKFAIMPYVTGGYYGYKVGARADSAMPSWTQTGVAISPNANSYMVCVDAEGNSLKENVEYHIDNVKLIGRMPKVVYPSTGVLVAEDFEGTSPAFVGGQATLAGDETNKYIEMYKATKAEDTYNSEKDLYAAEYGISKEYYFDSLPQNFVLTADICMPADNTQPFMFEYYTDHISATTTNSKGEVVDAAEEAYNMKLEPSEVTADQWYTLKIAKVGVKKYKATLINKTTGEVTTPTVGGRANISSISTYNRVSFRIVNGLSENDTTYHWLIDNVMVAEVGAASIISATAEGEAVNAKLNVDAYEDAAMAALAIYDGDRVIDVDFENLTLLAANNEANLAVNGEYDKAVVFLWSSVDVEPFMEAWDVTKNISVVEATPEA